MPTRSVITTSICLEPELLAEAKFAAEQRGFRYSLSAWVADLIRRPQLGAAIESFVIPS